MNCGITAPNAPRIALTLVAAGDPRLRLEKRLHCAATGLGLALDLTVSTHPAEFALRFEQTPAVIQRRDSILFTGLLRTEEIETQLRAAFGVDLGAVADGA